MAVDFGQKFRQSTDYLYDILIRDLLDYAKDQLAYGKTVDTSIANLVAADVAMDTRMDAAESAITALTNADTALDARLDALELEGTWTPAVTFGGNAVGLTYNSRRGSYRKIGKLVFIDFEVNMSARGSSTGAALIGGLPFATATTRPAICPVGFWDNMAFPAGSQGAILGYGGSELSVRYHTNVATGTADHSHFNNTSRFIGGGCYLAAS